MGSKVYDNDITTSSITDNRNAAGDNALLTVGGGSITANSGNTTNTNSGNTTTNTNTQTTHSTITNTQTTNANQTNSNNVTNNQTTNTDARVTNNQTIHNTTTDPAALLALTNNLPIISKQNADLAASTIAANARAEADARAALVAGNKDALDAVTKNAAMVVGDSLSFAQSVTSGNFKTVQDLAALVGGQGTANREFADTLVTQVLNSTKSADQQQTELFIKYAAYGVVVVVVALALPSILKEIK